MEFKEGYELMTCCQYGGCQLASNWLAFNNRTKTEEDANLGLPDDGSDKDAFDPQNPAIKRVIFCTVFSIH